MRCKTRVRTRVLGATSDACYVQASWAHDADGCVAEGVVACEGSVGAGGDGSSAGCVAERVHGAGDAVRGAEVGGALPVSDHWALGRRDDQGRSRGSVGGEDRQRQLPRPRSIPMAACAGRRRLPGRALPVFTCTKLPPAACTDARKYLKKRKASMSESGCEASAKVRRSCPYTLKFLRTHEPVR